MSVARRLSEFIEDIEEFSTYFEWLEVLSDYLSKKGDKSTSVINSYRTQIIPTEYCKQFNVSKQSYKKV